MAALVFRRGSAEAALVAFGQVFAAIGALVGIRILTHVMAPSAYGELALAMTAVTFLHQLLISPIQAAALRFYSSSLDVDALGDYARGIGWLTWRAIGVFMLLGALSIMGLLAAGQSSTAILGLWTTAFAVAYGLGQVVNSVQVAARRRAVSAWHDVGALWSRFLLAALFIYLTTESTSAVAMGGYAASALVVLLSQILIFPPRLTQSVPTEAAALRRKMISFASPLVLYGLAAAVQSSADRWALGIFGTTSDVGEFAVLFQVGYYPVTVFSNALVLLATPVIYARAGSAGDPARRRSARRLAWQFLGATAAIGSAMVVIAWFFREQVFNLLVASQYSTAAPLLPLVVMNAAFLACGQVASIALLMDNRTTSLTRAKSVTAVLSIIASVTGASIGGIRGIVILSILPSFIYAVWMIIMAVNPQSRGGRADANDAIRIVHGE